MAVRGLQNRMFCLARYPLSRTSSRYYIEATEQVRRVNLLAASRPVIQVTIAFEMTERTVPSCIVPSCILK